MTKFLRRTLSFSPIMLIVAALMLSSCHRTKKDAGNIGFDSTSSSQDFDLSDIEDAGELIAVTLSGPESYYQYHGIDMGLQYTLAERFANAQGLRLRMEIAHDTLELSRILRDRKADLIAYELPQSLIRRFGFKACGAGDAAKKTSWSVRRRSPQLAEALSQWYRPGMKDEATRRVHQLMTTPLVRHHSFLPIFSRSKGIISPYDSHFMRYSQAVGWDWRLMAAQCYQESGFDPQAVSWAGARGLMQIMPGTATQLGLPARSITDPETNIAASARYLRQISARFADVHNPLERTKFVLASYNGGYNHVRDAMNLARKYRRNPESWSDVSYFVLHLSEPRFYRDPVVKSGYMIGSETFYYVERIMQRWYGYCGIAGIRATSSSMDLHYEPSRARKSNRFSHHNKILTPSDTLFDIHRR